MAFDLTLLWVFAGVFVILCLVAFFAWGMKYALAYAINAVIGFFALYAVQAFQVVPDVVINVWSVALVAIGGIFGFALVFVFHLLGIFF